VVSVHHAAEIWTLVKRGEEEQTCVCVIHYNQHKGGIDKKDQLLPVYLVERKRMKKWYMKLLRRLFSAMVFNSLIIIGIIQDTMLIA
jgi:hypothetical protein